MTVLSAKGGTIKAAADGGTPALIAEIVSGSLEIKRESIDATAAADSWKKTLSGTGSWSASLDVHFISTDTSQDALRAAVFSGAIVEVEVAVGATVGLEKYTGEARVTSVSIDVVADGKTVTMKVDLEGTGALTAGSVA